jgi:dCMP deaminase
MLNDKWDTRFLDMSRLVGSWSKDPSTQTGAVIVDKNRRVVSVGYNGFAKGVNDDPFLYSNRELKYKMIVHCERNAIIFAQRSLEGCTLYTTPFASCAPCAAMVIQAGITRCVAPVLPNHLVERWQEELNVAAVMFREAGVELVLKERLTQHQACCCGHNNCTPAGCPTGGCMCMNTDG